MLLQTVKGTSSNVAAKTEILAGGAFGTAQFDLISGDGTSTQSHIGTLSLLVFAGAENPLQLFADASTRAGLGASSAYAFVDPFVFIDPTYLTQHPEFSISVSGDIANSVAAVPEPSTWGNDASRLRRYRLHDLSPEGKASIDGGLIYCNRQGLN